MASQLRLTVSPCLAVTWPLLGTGEIRGGTETHKRDFFFSNFLLFLIFLSESDVAYIISLLTRILDTEELQYFADCDRLLSMCVIKLYKNSISRKVENKHRVVNVYNVYKPCMDSTCLVSFSPSPVWTWHTNSPLSSLARLEMVRAAV